MWSERGERIATGAERPRNDTVTGSMWSGRTESSAPTEGYKGHGRRADVGIGPYGWVTRGAVERVVGDADPYARLQEVR